MLKRWEKEGSSPAGFYLGQDFILEVMANPWLTLMLKNVGNSPGRKQVSPFNFLFNLHKTLYLLLQIIFVFTCSRGMHSSNKQLSIQALQSCLFHLVAHFYHSHSSLSLYHDFMCPFIFSVVVFKADTYALKL